MTAAARELDLAPATISAAVRKLETALGADLFERQGRDLAVTAVGERVRTRAREIFAAGRELVEEVHSEIGRASRLTVGVSDALPKLVAREFLRSSIVGEGVGPLRVREGSADVLIAELLAHRLDLVLTDEPVRLFPGLKLPIVSLGSSAVDFLAHPSLAAKLRPGFPASLDGAPVLLPSPRSALRRSLDRWFVTRGLYPRVIGEFDDPALLKVFAREGHGFLALPRVVSEEAIEENGFSVIGGAEGCEESFYAVTSRRGSRRETVEGVLAAARDLLSS